MWGGFTEAERLRLLADGWDDLLDRSRGQADVAGLERRLRAGVDQPSQEYAVVS